MWREDSLLDAAVAHFGSRQPVHLLRQVVVGDRRIDGILIVGDRRIGLEAKVSRSDFRSESDAKRAPTWDACHECVYLSPPRIIEPGEVPPGWGLWHAVGPASIRVVRPGDPHRAAERAADALATGLGERLADLERRVRSAERRSDPTAALVAVDDEVARLSALVATRDAALRRERSRADDAAEQVLAALGRQVCDDCGHEITYTRVRAWRHLERGREARCERDRAEAERLRRQEMTGAAYVSVPAPRVIPAGLSMDR